MTRAEATSEHARKARRAAAVTSLCVAAFACAFIGLVLVLDQFAITKNQQELPSPSQVSVPQDPFYVLLIGSDTRKGTALYTGKASEHAQVDQHSDIMTLVRVDPAEFAISLLTVPRDTVVAGETDKINGALVQNDPRDVVDAVERLCGLRADYYMMTTFTSFEDLVDAIGGVQVDVPLDITVNDPGTGMELSLKAGPDQRLTGAEALALARARHEYGDDQDALRQSTVRSIEQAIIRQVLGYPDLVDVERLLPVVEEDVQTDFDMTTLGLLILDFIQNADKVTFLSGTGPYDGGPRESDGQWVVDDDPDAWAQIMKKFKKGKDYSGIVTAPTYAERQLQPEAASGSAAAASAGAAGKSSASSASSASASSGASSSSSSAASATASSAASAGADSAGAGSAASASTDAAGKDEQGSKGL